MITKTLDENTISLMAEDSDDLLTIRRILKTDDKISLFCDKGQVVFLTKEQVLTTRTLEGIYPNYGQLIPDDFSRCLEIDRQSFIAALERVAVLADQYNNVVKISAVEKSEIIHISADVQDVGSGSESLPASLTGESFQIAFNVRYLLDGLKSINTSRIFLRCNAPTTPAIFSPVDNSFGFTYLVMPVQIRS